MGFEVVVVGGGTAGCVLASRLSESPERRVCLLDAGPRIAQGSLPRGITPDRRTGVLSGVPREAGTFRVTAQVTERLGGKSVKRLSLFVTG